MTTIPEPNQEQLFTLYKIALDEYRFEVTLNNDRLFRFLVFNAAALSVGTGLLKTSGPPAINFFVILLFIAGAMSAQLGIRAVRKGHEYYRRAIYKKTLIETRLGLLRPLNDEPEVVRLGVDTHYPGATVAIATTVGQTEIDEILRSPEVWIKRPLRRGTIVQAGVVALQLLMVANFLAAGLAVAIALRDIFWRGVPVL